MKQDGASPRPTIPLLVLFSSFAVCMGGFIFMAAQGVIPVDPESFEAPRGVVAVMGAMFMLAGVAVAFQGLRQTPFGQTRLWAFLNSLLGMSVLLLLAIPFHWVAFGPGERQFTETVSLPFVRFTAGSRVSLGRVAFGGMAVLMDAVWLWGVFTAVRRFLQGGDEEA